MPRKIKVENLNEAEGMDAVKEEMQNNAVTEEPAVVAKPKAKGRAKKVEAEPEPVKEPVTPDKVACPDCGKKVSPKTLKYTHGANCKAKVQDHVHSGTCYQESGEDQKRRRKEERMSQLTAQAF